MADVWRELLLAAGHDKNPIDSFTRTLRSYPASPRRICPLHRDEFYDTLRRWIKTSGVSCRLCRPCDLYLSVLLCNSDPLRIAMP